MFKIIKALPFVVYELFTKVHSPRGKRDLIKKIKTKKYRKYGLFGRTEMAGYRKLFRSF